MQDKKSFVLYTDLIHTVRKLPDDKAGLLFKHILSYVNDENPETDDILVDISFEPIKQILKRDLVKWEKRTENSRENGKKGGRPKKPKKPSGLNKNPSEPKKPDSVNVSVSVNVNDTLLEKDTKVFSFKGSLLGYGFDKKLIDEWLRVRKTKKATNTETAYNSFILEVEKTNQDPNVILRTCIEKDWKGFKSSWLEGERKNSAQKKDSIQEGNEQIERIFEALDNEENEQFTS